MSAPDQGAPSAAVEESLALADALRTPLAGHDHGIQTTALLTAFIRLAIAHPCCTDACIQQLGKAAFVLAQEMAARQGKPLH